MNALLSSHVALASTVPVCWHILYSKRIRVGICAENIYIKKAEKQIFMRCTLDGVNSHADGGHKTAGMQCYKYLYNCLIFC